MRPLPPPLVLIRTRPRLPIVPVQGDLWYGECAKKIRKKAEEEEQEEMKRQQ